MKLIIQKSLEDIFSTSVLLFVLKIASASFILTLFLTWGLWDSLSAFITSYLSWIPWDWLQTTGASVMTFTFSYMLFTVIIALLTSLYSEKLLISLAQKHYPNVPVVGSPSIMISLLLTLKASAVFMGLFMLLFPLIFVPILGQVVLLYFWSILLKEPTVYDVGRLFINDKATLKAKRKKTRVLAMIASLFNYIPFLNVFASVFGQILFLHHILRNK